MSEYIGGMGRRGKPLGTLNWKTDVIYLMGSAPNPTDEDYLNKIKRGEFIVKSEKTQESFYENIMSRILNAYHKLVC